MNRILSFFKISYENIRWFTKLFFPLGKKVYFIGTPEYPNLGDNAIAIAQEQFLCKCGISKRKVKVFSHSNFIDFSGLFKRYVTNNSLICCIGGGNLGNQWYEEELFRYRVFKVFPDNPIVVFPQTVFFTNDEGGEKALRKSIQEYSSHRSVTIVARDVTSFDFLKNNFFNVKLLLCPDIVLSASQQDFGINKGVRSNVLLVFRDDAEQQLSDEIKKELLDLLSKRLQSYIITDMYSSIPVTDENRFELVREKMQQFADAKLVITDRLHGMIFSALTGTPCIVFENYNHKISEAYSWISYLPYISFVSSDTRFDEIIDEVLNYGEYEYDNSPLEPNYVALSKVIKSYVN